jgi:enoyl-CoA hydratase
MTSYNTITLEHINEFILQITLNRPEAMNAINSEMMQELQHFWEGMKKKSVIRCIILTGNGKAFCAGADLKERKNLDVTTWRKQRNALENAMLAMIDCPCPVIAAVNGAAFGGGLELILAADFAYAVDNAVFAQSETKWGLIPGAMGTQNLPRACGSRRAKELCFTAESFNAEEALHWNIVNKLSRPENLLSDVINVAQKIAANAPLAVRYAKQAINTADHTDIKTGFAFEVKVYNQVLPSKDREEGIKAFNEKRAAEFTGE